MLQSLSRVLFFSAMASAAFSQTLTSQDVDSANQAYNSRNYIEAEQLYQAAIQSDPNNAVAYQGLGNCELAQGHKKKAIADYNQSLSINSNNPQLAAYVQKLEAQASTDSDAPAARSTHRGGGGGSFQYNGPEWDSSLGTAFGPQGAGFGEDSVYYFMNTNDFGLGIAGNFYIFFPSSSSYSVNYFAEELLQFRVNFGDGAVRPFILGGGGLNEMFTFNSSSYNSSFSDVTDPMATVGGGVLFSLTQYLRIYLQGRVAMVFLNNSSIGYSEQNGITQNPPPGGILTYVPVQAGLAFSL